MHIVSSPHVWALLTANERAAVVATIVRVLTEEVENERFHQDSSHPSGSGGDCLHPAIGSQTGPEESLEQLQPACAA